MKQMQKSDLHAQVLAKDDIHPDFTKQAVAHTSTLGELLAEGPTCLLLYKR